MRAVRGARTAACLLAAVMLLAASGCGSDDDAAPETGGGDERSETTGRNGEPSKADDGPADDAPAVSSELCEAAEPLWSVAPFLSQEEGTQLRANLAEAYARMAQLSEGEMAELFTTYSQNLKDDETARLRGPDVYSMLAGCAETTLELVIDEDGLAELPAKISSGLTSLKISNQKGNSIFLVIPMQDGDGLQELADHIEFGFQTEPVTFSQDAKDGSIYLTQLDPGTYGIVAAPRPPEVTESFPGGIEFGHVLVVE